MRKTKIVATIGPATNNYESMKELILNGINVIRMNMSHSSQEEHQVVVDLAKKLRKQLHVPVALMLDTRGPEIRVKSFKEGSVCLLNGKPFVFTKREVEGTNECVSITQPEIIDVVPIGSKILACNSLITFKVVDKNKTDLICKVLDGGIISNNKSLSFPKIKYNFPYLNELDKKDIIWGIKNDIDYIAASFVNSKEDIAILRNFIKENNGDIDIISKVESAIGIENLDEIIENSDAIMVARGDLGVELPLEQIPTLQKTIIRKCVQKGKMVITATEMLESMVFSPRPTRAEASDVANAVFDGTSAVMLSAESAVGKYPVKAVSTMSKIALQMEGNIDYKKYYETNKVLSEEITDIMSDAVASIAHNLKSIKAIVVYTDSGHTAKMISRYTPNCPIIAFTPNKSTYYKLSLVWNVYPILTKELNSADKLLKTIDKELIAKEIAKTDDTILIGTGTRKPTNTDMIKLHIIGSD